MTRLKRIAHDLRLMFEEFPLIILFGVPNPKPLGPKHGVYQQDGPVRRQILIKIVALPPSP